MGIFDFFRSGKKVAVAPAEATPPAQEARKEPESNKVASKKAPLKPRAKRAAAKPKAKAKRTSKKR